MVIALLTAGIVSVLAGLAAIVYGVQLKEFSFGTTMIGVGASAVCTGMLLMGLWVVVGELRQIGRRLMPRTSAEPRGRPGLPAPGTYPLRGVEAGPLFGREDAADADDLETAAPPVSPLPWQDDAAPRERPRMPPLPEFNPEPAPLRIGRDRQFPPTRRDRERAASRPVEPLGSDGSGGEAAESASANFENAWPELKKNYDERFHRMWRYYLLASAGGFRSRNMQLWQFVFTRTGTMHPECRFS